MLCDPDKVEEIVERSFDEEKNKGIHDDSVSHYDMDQPCLDHMRINRPHDRRRIGRL